MYAAPGPVCTRENGVHCRESYFWQPWKIMLCFNTVMFNVSQHSPIAGTLTASVVLAVRVRTKSPPKFVASLRLGSEDASNADA